MLTQTDVIVSLWMLPVIIFIVVPLGMLVAWGIVKTLRKSKQRANDLQKQFVTDETGEGRKNLEVPAAAN